MEFEIGVEGSYGCASFRNELCIHIISHMMRVVVPDRIISKIANIRHGVWMKRRSCSVAAVVVEPVDATGDMLFHNIVDAL